MEQLTGSKLGKEYNKALCCHPIYLTYMHHEYIMQNARLDDSQAGIKIPRKNISNLRYDSNTTLMAESKEELKTLLMTVKERKQSCLVMSESLQPHVL